MVNATPNEDYVADNEQASETPTSKVDEVSEEMEVGEAQAEDGEEKGENEPVTTNRDEEEDDSNTNSETVDSTTATTITEEVVEERMEEESSTTRDNKEDDLSKQQEQQQQQQQQQVADSSSSVMKPPEEETQEQIIAKLEEEFKDRYTAKDPVYVSVQELKEVSPPVVTNFGGSSYKDSNSSRTSRNDQSSSNHRTRSRSRSPSAVTAKRKGAFGCHSYFVFYY